MMELEIDKEYWIKAKYKKTNDFNEYPFWFEVVDALDGMVMLKSVSEVKEVIPEREKVTIPNEVADWIEHCKERGDLVEAVNPIDFCTNKKVVDWYENQEFAEEILAKAYLIGYEVEEPLGVLLVDMPKNALWVYTYLTNRESEGQIYVDRSDLAINVMNHGLKVTEAEAKEKYPNFKWVSLEDLK